MPVACRHANNGGTAWQVRPINSLGGKTDPLLAQCWLWWAQYGPASLIPPNWQTFTLWQYTDGHNGNPPHEVDGVVPCDRELYQGSADDLKAKWATGTLA